MPFVTQLYAHLMQDFNIPRTFISTYTCMHNNILVIIYYSTQ